LRGEEREREKERKREREKEGKRYGWQIMGKREGARGGGKYYDSRERREGESAVRKKVTSIRGTPSKGVFFPGGWGLDINESVYCYMIDRSIYIYIH
jgi:hypothetical protein